MESAAPRRIPVLPLVGLGMVLVAGIFAILISRSAAVATDWANHSAHVQQLIAELGERLSDHESAFRGYIWRGDPRMVRDLRNAESSVLTGISDLERATADNPRQQASAARLKTLVAERFAYDHSRMAERNRVGPFGLTNGPRQEHAYALATGIRTERARLIGEEKRLTAERQAAAEQRISALSLGLAAGVMLVVVVGYLMIADARGRYLSLQAAHDEARASAAAAHAQMLAREEAEEKLRQSQKMESIGQLTGGIAHDFNNMLAVIIGGLDMARRRIDDRARLLRSIESALDGAERAAALVARLLAFSRRQPLKPAALDPNRLVDDMAELLERTLGEQITVVTSLAADMWQSYADPVQLENAILNLAVNARDAMGDAGGTLRIITDNVTIDAAEARAHAELVPGDYARIAVADDGCGMSPEVIARAFDPFFTTKSVGKGTGLGLSQVFGFVKQSGGHVTIASEVGRGTTISLLLPRLVGARARGAEHRLNAAPASPTGGERILVVEDDERVRRYSVEALRELGYTPIAVDHGAAALDLVGRDTALSLLFTDVVMPGMSGPQLATAVRAIRPELKILYTTGYAREGLSQPAMLDRTVPVLPKPFTVSQLANKVRQAIDG